MKLFLIRHGQSEANLGMRYTGQFDVPLTSLGREQAVALRPILEPITFDRVYSSDLSRAVDTCSLALPNMEIEKTPLLREVDVGTLLGKLYSEVRKFQPDDPTMRPDFTPFGGENLAMVSARAREFLAILEKSNHSCVAAFSHRGFMVAMLNQVLGTRIDRGAIQLNNCAVIVLEYDGRQWYLASVNYMKPIAGV